MSARDAFTVPIDVHPDDEATAATAGDLSVPWDFEDLLMIAAALVCIAFVAGLLLAERAGWVATP